MGREWLVVWTIIAAFSSHFLSQEVVLKYRQWFQFNIVYKAKMKDEVKQAKAIQVKMDFLLILKSFLKLMKVFHSREIFIQIWKFVKTVCGSYDSNCRISLFI